VRCGSAVPTREAAGPQWLGAAMKVGGWKVVSASWRDFERRLERSS
jgi:hypothetical protein